MKEEGIIYDRIRESAETGSIDILLTEFARWGGSFY